MASPAARTTVQVAVQSPSRLLRDTLASCLDVRPGVDVVGMVAQPDDVLALCELRRPDVVIMDAGPQLGVVSGTVERLMLRFPELTVIVTYREAIQKEIRDNAQRSLAANLNKLVQPEAMEQPDPRHYNEFLQNAIQILDTLVLSIELPPEIVAAINRQTEQYYMIQEYKFRVEREAEESKRIFQIQLKQAGKGTITTEILQAPTFYYAEDYHQQYLAKNPGGYCPNHSCGSLLGTASIPGG